VTGQSERASSDVLVSLSLTECKELRVRYELPDGRFSVGSFSRRKVDIVVQFRFVLFPQSA